MNAVGNTQSNGSAKDMLFFRGRVALFHVLKTLGVGSGDEVVLQAFTCVAVPEAVMATGARPVWVDLAENSVNLDPVDLACKLTPRTKAVIVQHTFGIPAELDAVMPLLETWKIPLIEDCCHAFASTHRQRVLGTIGAGAFWSYEWGKPVLAGVGGELVCNDPVLHARAAAEYQSCFRSPPVRRNVTIAIQYCMHGLLYGPRRFWSVRRVFHLLGSVGVAQSNYNPVGPGVAMAADFGWQMCGFSHRRLADARVRAVRSVAQRRQQAKRYEAALHPTAARIPSAPLGSDIVYSRFPIFVREKDNLLQAACSINLELAAWYATPVHPLAGEALARVSYLPGSCPRAEAATKMFVSLPLGSKVNPAFQDALIELINRHAAS